MRNQILRPFYVLLIISLLIQSKCSSDGSGAIDGIELGRGLWLDLENLSRLASYNPAVGENLTPFFNNLPQELDSLRIYSATTELREQTVSVKVIVIPLRQTEFAGSYLAINVLNDGTVERVRIWGNEYVNQDADSYIENFYRQFDRKRRLLRRAEMMARDEAEEYISSLDEKEKYLYEHPLIMRGNSLIIRRTMALTGQDEVPSVQWYQLQETSFSNMIKNADLLEGFLGAQAIGEYKKAAQASSDALKLVVEGVNSGAKAGKVRDLIMNYRQVGCGNCHEIKSNPGSELSAYQAGNKHTAKNLREGIYKVGFDIWPIPDNNMASLYLTDMVKAGVFYLSYLEDRK